MGSRGSGSEQGADSERNQRPGLLGALGSAVSDAANAVGSALSDAANAVGNAVSDAANAIGNAISDIF